jgi:hypothetical protein
MEKVITTIMKITLQELILMSIHIHMNTDMLTKMDMTIFMDNMKI